MKKNPLSIGISFLSLLLILGLGVKYNSYSKPLPEVKVILENYVKEKYPNSGIDIKSISYVNEALYYRADAVDKNNVEFTMILQNADTPKITESYVGLK